ncbi:MAG: hypothetical protein KBT87_02745 [Gammaproteobacteria bacterium]|nr:hypothetical protein [Gammaproteobacteria bacterium]MBQ0773569.1 hypothetical protein [Gammaproteobacteria bacterium]
MRWSVVVLTLIPTLAFAAAGQEQRLCAAAIEDGALAAEVELLASTGEYQLASADQLLTLDCDGETLLTRMIETTQAENLEYAVIDMGANVNHPLIAQEGGKLTVVQYLIQQAVVAPSVESREFAMDYMQELRDVDFNPNLLSLSMN